ncbi:hypothetical protein BN1723_010461 [Verticillium longisporum]|uniref:Porphobilinogen deaminase n=1 Tax=Verticillium longisporum TaxID=100787 RepID=A0A0G4KY95_VERLO|nr:hypothetical protein BN1723_010461 [Verticillium longisporum]
MAAAPTSDSGNGPAASAASTVRIGTRRSALAVRQTELVIEAFKRIRPDYIYEIHAMQTLGDKDQVTALYNFGGKGLWTNELEAKLTNNEIDVIVHSLKDMPTVLPEGCILGAVVERENPHDVVVFKDTVADQYKSIADLPAGSVVGTSSIRRIAQLKRNLKDMPTVLPEGCILGAVVERENPHDVVVFKDTVADQYKSIADLPAGSVVGTSSIRRIAQLKRKYPGLQFADVRGNIQTRLAKLDDPDGPFTAIILAAAGLLRMDLGGRIGQYLASDTGGILHAVGQGALGIEARTDDDRVLTLLRGIEHGPTRLAAEAERSVMRTLEGGCSVPIGVETTWRDDGKTLTLKASVTHVDGTHGVDGESTRVIESPEAADQLGRDLAVELVDRGAQTILDDINQNRPGDQPATLPAAAAS